MVSTRGHPNPFPPPDLAVASLQSSPTKPTSSPSKASPSKRIASGSSSTSTALSKRLSSTSTTSNNGISHTPTKLTLLWLAISLPLVLWDAGYVLLRPHSMPGGYLHSPIWKPYALYGTIDYIYGWPAYNAKNGFTGAQTWMNLVETVGYFVYLGLVYGSGQHVVVSGEGEAKKSVLAGVLDGRVLSGRAAAKALLVGFAAAVMTLSKTVLYWLNEACSGFESIGHNDPGTLFVFWILPNGLWLVFPAIMIYVFANEILDFASGVPAKKLE